MASLSNPNLFASASAFSEVSPVALPPGPRHARDNPAGDWIVSEDKHNWNVSRGALRGQNYIASSHRKNEIDMMLNDLARSLIGIVLIVGDIIDDKVLAFHVA
jgi:hypothetical protein